ncbi:TPA: hypothetical protein DIC39_01235 [Patescibacteria group bacterium]|nr:hypothetical protein [Patescibacteria group bacterium]HCU47671.1 hypothetical protein [Patescibacteria group bacterium]
MSEFTKRELKILKKLSTPAKIQDWLEKIPANFERAGETCRSPRMVLKTRTAHCIEGAMLAAAALRLQGRPPLLVDLKAVSKDDDHVIAVFHEQGRWGAISKVNHNVLRYRDPVYRDIRELAMSYFHEYFLQNRSKSLRSYSNPVDLSRFDKRGWMTSDKNLWYIADYLDQVRHYPILTNITASSLRRVDHIEIKAGNIERWPKHR